NNCAVSPRSAQVRGAIHAGRVGEALSFEVQRGGANSAQKATNLFQRLDDQRTWCQLKGSDVVGASPSTAPAGREVRPLAESWDADLTELPPDWSDLLCESAVHFSALL